MGRFIVIFIVVALIVGLWARSAMVAKRRRKEQQPEINKHPERLEQSLDPTDDA